MANEPDEAAKQSKGAAKRETAQTKHRARDRSRGRERDRGQFGIDSSGYDDVVHDFNRLAYAFSRASSRVYFDMSRVIGDLVLNLTDSVYNSYQVAATDDSEDDDLDTRGSRRLRDRYRFSTEQLSDDVSNSLSQAIHDAADVFAESADEYAAVHHDESGRTHTTQSTTKD